MIIGKFYSSADLAYYNQGDKFPKLIVTNINNYEKVNVDDEIYTSGLGNLPDNIYIGKVKSINLNNTEIEKVVEVNINDRLEKLDYLFIRSNHD